MAVSLQICRWVAKHTKAGLVHAVGDRLAFNLHP